MKLYDFLVHAYNSFLSVFPPGLQWAVTLLIVIGLIGAFIGLVRHHALFLIILVILLPLIIPVLGHFFGDVYQFFLYLLQTLRLTTPQT